MFRNLNPVAKKLILGSIIVLSIMLLIFGYLFGKEVEEKELQLQKEEEKKQEELEMQEGFSMDELEEQQEREKQQEEREIRDSLSREELEGEPMHGDYEYTDPMVDFDEDVERETGALEDFFDKEKIEQSIETTKAFIEAYYPFNGDKPLEHIQNAKNHMTERLYGELDIDIPPRPSDNYYATNIKDYEVYEPYNHNDKENIVLVVRINGEVLNAEGEKEKDEVVEYEVKLSLDNQDLYKIDDYKVTSMH